MCWKNRLAFVHTLTFRLMLWYAAVFAVLSVIGFTIIYFQLAAQLARRLDRELTADLREMATFYAGENLTSLQTAFNSEAEGDGKKYVFLKLLSPQGKLLASSDLGAWKELDAFTGLAENFNGPGVRFRTYKFHNRHRRVRIAMLKVPDHSLLQIGRRPHDNHELLEEFRGIFLAVFVLTLLVSSGVGWMMARRAMAGVERITRVASGIGRNDLDRRVPLKNEGREIVDLAKAFNEMLERIQALVFNLKEVTNNIAHDLRTPLTRIRGMAESALTLEQPMEAYREMAALAVEESDRLVGMINTMLEIARTDSGVEELNQQQLDLRAIIESAWDLFLPVAEDKGLHVGKKLTQEPLLIRGDRAKLQRVVANLLDNAIKYTPAGGKITIMAQAGDRDAVISIADTGMGIPEKDRTRIFERFYRGDESRSTPGSGLGLSLALAIVRAHGGDITVTSESGQGSRFTVVLPRQLLPEK